MQQQQQEAVRPVQTHNKQVQRGLHPWRRVIVGLVIILILISLTVIGLLATGHLYDVAFVAPAAVGLLIAIVAVLAWLFPLNPVNAQPPLQLSPAQPSDRPVSTAQVSVSLAGPTPLSPMPPATQVFYFAQPMPSPAEFYGRAYERRVLLERTSKRSSTALVGEYRIGKSWLMQYLQQVAPDHAPPGTQVRVGRLSATNPQCQTLAGFVKKGLEALNVPVHRPNPRETPLERLTIEVGALKKQSIIPVLCIDEFAGLMGKPGFDKNFVEGLRAIAEDEGLVLVTASREPLHTVIEHITGQTSPLFNIMPELTLHPFTEAEARIFIREKGQRSGLSANEQAFFLECAAISQTGGVPGWPPIRLQLVGQMLLADKYPPTPAQHVYAPGDSAYQTDFKQRLDAQYRAVVKHQ